MLRGAWSDGPLEYGPEFHDVSPDVTVTSKPAVRRAARIGDAWCAPSSLSVEGVREQENVEGAFQVYVIFRTYWVYEYCSIHSGRLIPSSTG